MFSIVLLGSCNKPGCTDPDAVNYDSSANDEDGTCQYVPSLSTTPLIYDTIAFSVQTGGIISSEGNSQITIKGICWSNSPNPTVNNDTTIDGLGVGNFISNISNLNYNTTYFFRAYATNSNGTGYGNELSLNIGSFTNIPDANFEQALIDLGYDNVIDGKVLTNVVNQVESIMIDLQSIYDLTGIEAFTSLTQLECSRNLLTSLDVSNNTALIVLYCNNNQLTSLDVSNNTALTDLSCGTNQLTSLDVSNNTALNRFSSHSNQLTCLNLKNGNNTNFINMYANFNPNLNCIEVDDPTWASNNWISGNGHIDPGTTFSTNCNYPAGCF